MTAISAKTFITDTLRAVDSVIGHFVQLAYQNLIHDNATTITLLFTLYILLLGYRFMTHTLSADMTSITQNLVVLLVVYGLIMNWALYNKFVYDIFTNEPEHIARVFVTSTGQISSSQNVGQALNGIYHSGMEAADILFAKNSIKLFVCGFVVACFTIVACLQALIFFIYAKMVMAMMLALGPLFILFILWESTKGWFMSWLRSLFMLALIPILTVTILALMLSIINTVIQDLILEVQQADPNFFTVAVFVGLSIVNFSLLKQVLPLASSLSGGFNLSNLNLRRPKLPNKPLQTLTQTIQSVMPKDKLSENKGSNLAAQNHSMQNRNSRRASAAYEKKKI